MGLIEIQLHLKQYFRVCHFSNIPIDMHLHQQYHFVKHFLHSQGQVLFQNLQLLAAGEGVGTLLWPDNERMTARQQWLVGHLHPQGQIILDDGAVEVIRQQGKSVLPVGVKMIEGDFKRGDLVICLDMNGQEIACGLANYSANEANKIKGNPSTAIEELLGYVDEPELIHRDNLVVTA